MEMFKFAPVEFDLVSILPVLLASLGGVLGLLFEIVNPKKDNGSIVAVSLLSLLAAVAGVVYQFSLVDVARETFGGMILIDRFGLSMQLLVLVAAVLSILFSEAYLRAKRIPFGEFYPLLLWCVVGGLIMCSTQNLLMMFLGIEILSIALYVLAGMNRSDDRSEESALKYFLLGSFASGFLLYGIAMLYGGSGSLNLGDMGPAWLAADSSIRGIMVLGGALMLIGLGFKAGFVPFHQWTPDVYQGAPTNVSAFMAAGSKIGALAALWRVLEGISMYSQIWMPALTVVAILTMTVGNLLALVQKDVKRILGYSSISHAGYVLVAMLAHFESPVKVGFQSMAYYLMAYTLMTIGAFAVVALTANPNRETTTLDDIRGLRQRAPLAAGALAIFMFSLAGVPPMSGFFGKLLIFGDAMTANLQLLAIVLAVNSIISAYYYLGIAKAAFVDEPAEGLVPFGKPLLAGVTSASVICAVGVVAGTLLLAPILEFFTGIKTPIATPPKAAVTALESTVAPGGS